MAVGTHFCQLCLIHSAKHTTGWCRELQLVHGCVLLLDDCQQLQFLLYLDPTHFEAYWSGENGVCLRSTIIGVIGFGLRTRRGGGQFSGSDGLLYRSSAGVRSLG